MPCELENFSEGLVCCKDVANNMSWKQKGQSCESNKPFCWMMRRQDQCLQKYPGYCKWDKKSEQCYNAGWQLRSKPVSKTVACPPGPANGIIYQRSRLESNLNYRPLSTPEMRDYLTNWYRPGWHPSPAASSAKYAPVRAPAPRRAKKIKSPKRVLSPKSKKGKP